MNRGASPEAIQSLPKSEFFQYVKVGKTRCRDVLRVVNRRLPAGFCQFDPYSMLILRGVIAPPGARL